MKKFILGLVILTSSITLFAGLKENVKKEESFTWVTDENGVLNPRAILYTKLEQKIKMRTIDGKVFEATMESVKVDGENNCKMFGTITNYPEAAFGFGFTKDGAFAGSILLTKDECLYIVKYSEQHNGFVIVKEKSNPENPSNFEKKSARK